MAIKIEEKEHHVAQIFNECEIYNKLKEAAERSNVKHFFPEVHYCASVSEKNILVMDLLGPSIEDLFKAYNRIFQPDMAALVVQ